VKKRNESEFIVGEDDRINGFFIMEHGQLKWREKGKGEKHKEQKGVG
jgi:hypothetical protein